MKQVSEKTKALNVILGIAFYIFVPLFFIIINKYDFLHKPMSIILAYQIYLFNAIKIYLPIFILLVPLIIKLLYKVNFYKSIIIGFIFLLLYIPFVFAMQDIIIQDVKSFSKEKWQQKVLLRGFMLDDLNNKYKLKKMNVKEINKLLGKPSNIDDNTRCYIIDPEKEYCFVFDSDVVVNMYIK